MQEPEILQNLVLRPIHESSHILSCVELEGEAEAGEYLFLLLGTILKQPKLPVWFVQMFFSLHRLPLFWTRAGGENNIATWFSFHFQVGAAVKPGVFIPSDQALPKPLQQTLLLLITGTGPVYTTWDIFG